MTNKKDDVAPTWHGAEKLRALLDPIESLRLDEKNARLHDNRSITAVRASLTRFGQRKPIVVRDGVVIAGNGTLQAARLEGWTHIATVDADGLTDEQVRAYAIADNRTAELSSWDYGVLHAEMAALSADIPTIDLGWTPAELKNVAQQTADKPNTNRQDDTVKNAVNRAKPGDVWSVGRHIVACGDSTDTEMVRRLTGGLIQSLFWDPPWDMGFTPPAAASTIAFTDGRRCRDVIANLGAPAWVFVWDCVSSWYTPNRPLQRSKLALWYGDIHSYNPEGSHYGDAGDVRTVTNTRGTYEFTPNPQGKHLSDVFSLPITKLHSESEHSHSKPVDWVRMLIANCTSGDVFDPFLGSGASLIACEQLGRRCVGIEIDPAACDTAIARWESFTGCSAVLLPAA
jgi:hypothetical protein